jgi:hypothetical protein
MTTMIIVISIKMKTTLGFMGRRPAFSSSAAAAASSSCSKRKQTPADPNCFRKVCSSVRLSHLLWALSSWAAAAASSSRGFDYLGRPGKENPKICLLGKTLDEMSSSTDIIVIIITVITLIMRERHGRICLPGTGGQMGMGI